MDYYKLGQAAARAHNAGSELVDAYSYFTLSADIAMARKQFRAGYDSAREHKPENVLLLRIVNLISEHRRGQGWPDDSEAYNKLISDIEPTLYKMLTEELDNEQLN